MLYLILTPHLYETQCVTYQFYIKQDTHIRYTIHEVNCVARLDIKYHIYELRTEKQMSVRHLARLSGISKTAINDIENGKHVPNIETICSLCYAMDVSLNDIVTFSKISKFPNKY